MSDNLSDDDIVRYEECIRAPGIILGTDGSVTTRCGRRLSPYENYSGYDEFVYRAYQSDKSDHIQVHRAIAVQFVKNIKHSDMNLDDLVVNHIDKNKRNNAASNLEWCTHSENSLHSVKDQRRPLLRFNKYSYDLVDGAAKQFVCSYLTAEVASRETGINFYSLNHQEDGHVSVVFPSEGHEGFLLEKTGSRARSKIVRFENRVRELPDGFVQHTHFPDYAVKDGGRLMRINSKEEYFPKPRGRAKPRIGLYVFDKETGKTRRVTIGVNKLIALQFIPIPERLRGYNIDNLRVISKIGDRFDYHSHNLEWATIHDTCPYKLRQKIYQYDLNGNLLGEFATKASAFYQTGVSPKKIARILDQGKAKPKDPFMWRYHNVSQGTNQAVPVACCSTDPGPIVSRNIELEDDIVVAPAVFSVEERIRPYMPSFPVFQDSIRNGPICICDDRWNVLAIQPNIAKVAAWLTRKGKSSGVTHRLIVDVCEGRAFFVRGYRMKYANDNDPAKVIENGYNDDNPMTWRRYTYNPSLVVSQFGHVFSLVDMRLEYPDKDGVYDIEGSDEKFTPEQLADSVYHDTIEKYPHHWKVVEPKPESRDVVVSLRGIVYISTNDNGGYTLLNHEPKVKKPVVNIKGIKKKRYNVNDLVKLAWNGRNMIED